jgi:hypothetical protein
MKTTSYWRKPNHVTAVRITDQNIKELADQMDATFVHHSDDETPFIFVEGDQYGYAGDWLVLAEDKAELWKHEAFMRDFRTFAEEMAENEKLAKIHSLIVSAMSKQDAATYHGESSSGMDIVAMQTAKDILAVF